MPVLLGEIMLQRGLVTQPQIDEILEYKINNRERFGNSAVKLGFIGEYVFIKLLAEQLSLPYLDDLSTFRIEDVALSVIPKEMAWKLNVIPLFLLDNQLTVATDDPIDIMKMDNLARATNKRIQRAVAQKDDITRAIENYYTIERTVSAEKKELIADAKTIELTNSILDDAMAADASDVHIEPGQTKVAIRYRVDGLLKVVNELTTERGPAVTSRFKVLAGLDIAESRKPQDGRIHHETRYGRSIDLRVSTYPSAYGEKVVMRLLDESKGGIALDKLGLSKKTISKWENIYSGSNGIVLVTGPTGSGKSTTLYATLTIKNTVDVNIVTIEDPIEYKLEGITQGQVNARAGMSFAAALRSMLRQDPDIIMVGEMRDLETIQLAVRAALTGHLVFSTLHTNDASSSYTRMMDMGIEPFLISSTVRGILAQRLIRRLCPKCKKEETISESAAKFIKMKKSQKVFTIGKKDCKNCNGTGYKGRAGLYELLLPSEEINEMVRNSALSDEIEKQAVKEGMVTLFDEGQAAVLSGKTSVEEIRRVI